LTITLKEVFLQSVQRGIATLKKNVSSITVKGDRHETIKDTTQLLEKRAGFFISGIGKLDKMARSKI